MDNKTRQSNTLANKYQRERREKNDIKIERDKLKKDLKEAQDIIGAMTSEIFDLSKLNKRLANRWINGGYAVTYNDGYVSSITPIQQYSDYIPLQEISEKEMNNILKYIKTPLYQKKPFVKVNDKGNIDLDKTQYNKFKGAIL